MDEKIKQLELKNKATENKDTELETQILELKSDVSTFL